MKPSPEQDDNVLQGIMLISGAVFLLALADALVKYLSANISLWQLYVLASLVSTPTLIGLIIVRSDARFGVESLYWVVVRSLLLLLMWVAYYASLPLIPLSVAAVAIYTTPLFIAILASMGTAEYLSRRGWAGIIFGFLGIVMVLRPSGDAFAAASLLPVMAAMLYALAMVATRRHCQREHPLLLALGLNLAFLGAGSFFSAVLAVAGTGNFAEHAPFLFSTWQQQAAILQSMAQSPLLIPQIRSSNVEIRMPKYDNQTTPPAKPRFRQVVGSVFAAMLGVQKRDNLERDTGQGSVVPYIVTALILVAVLTFILVGVATVASR